MPKEAIKHQIPKVLTIAGSDASGGAGIQADIKTFTQLGVYGASVVTSITAQGAVGVTHRFDLPLDTVSAQLETLLRDIKFDAIKIGMLPNEEIVSLIASKAMSIEVPIILDPLISSSSGSAFIEKKGFEVLLKKLLPLCSLITPNISEASELVNMDEKEIICDLEDGAKMIYDQIGIPILLKGGHLEHDNVCIDTYFDGNDLKQFKNKRINTGNTHGTGCTLSSAIAAHMSRLAQEKQAHSRLEPSKIDASTATVTSLASRAILSDRERLLLAIESAISDVHYAIKESDKICLYDDGYGPVNHLALNTKRYIE